MLNKKDVNINLEDLDFIKSIESANKYMNFGLSGHQDAQEKVAHYELLEKKFIESQNKIENNFNVIEYVVDNCLSNRKRGALFEKKALMNVNRTKTKKKSNKF